MKMNKEKAINQLQSLVEHFENGSNDINNDDIDAIKYILDYINKPTIDISSLCCRPRYVPACWPDRPDS